MLSLSSPSRARKVISFDSGEESAGHSWWQMQLPEEVPEMQWEASWTRTLSLESVVNQTRTKKRRRGVTRHLKIFDPANYKKMDNHCFWACLEFQLAHQDGRRAHINGRAVWHLRKWLEYLWCSNEEVLTMQAAAEQMKPEQYLKQFIRGGWGGVPELERVRAARRLNMVVIDGAGRLLWQGDHLDRSALIWMFHREHYVILGTADKLRVNNVASGGEKYSTSFTRRCKEVLTGALCSSLRLLADMPPEFPSLVMIDAFIGLGASGSSRGGASSAHSAMEDYSGHTHSYKVLGTCTHGLSMQDLLEIVYMTVVDELYVSDNGPSARGGMPHAVLRLRSRSAVRREANQPPRHDPPPPPLQPLEIVEDVPMCLLCGAFATREHLTADQHLRALVGLRAMHEDEQERVLATGLRSIQNTIEKKPVTWREASADLRQEASGSMGSVQTVLDDAMRAASDAAETHPIPVMRQFASEETKDAELYVWDGKWWLCILCGKWADKAHLDSQKHLQKLRRHHESVGPVKKNELQEKRGLALQWLMQQSWHRSDQGASSSAPSLRGGAGSAGIYEQNSSEGCTYDSGSAGGSSGSCGPLGCGGGEASLRCEATASICVQDALRNAQEAGLTDFSDSDSDPCADEQPNACCCRTVRIESARFYATVHTCQHIVIDEITRWAANVANLPYSRACLLHKGAPLPSWCMIGAAVEENHQPVWTLVSWPLSNVHASYKLRKTCNVRIPSVNLVCDDCQATLDRPEGLWS